MPRQHVRRVKPGRKDGHVRWGCTRCKTLHVTWEEGVRCYHGHMKGRLCEVCGGPIPESKKWGTTTCGETCRSIKRHRKNGVQPRAEPEPKPEREPRYCLDCSADITHLRTDALYCVDGLCGQRYRRNQSANPAI